MELFALMSLAVVAGLVSFSSPCTLPLLPGYVSYVSGLSSLPGRGSALPVLSRRRVQTGALLFVVGFSIVFVVLGATSSAIGYLLVRNLRVVNLVGGALIVVMGLSMTHVIRIPAMQRYVRTDPSRWSRGRAGALPLGAAFAFGWTPCVGPVLASILATAAGTATASRGALLLLAYSLGLGVPFLLLARGVAHGRERMQWLRRHSRHIEVAGGVALTLMGIGVMTGGWTALMSRMLALYARVGWPPI